MTINTVGTGTSSTAVSGVRKHGHGHHAKPEGADQSASGQPQDAFRSDFRDMVSSIQSGDMTSAKTALSALSKDVGASTLTYSNSSANDASTPSISGKFQSLFAAVNSGDATAAQQALANLRS